MCNMNEIPQGVSEISARHQRLPDYGATEFGWGQVPNYRQWHTVHNLKFDRLSVTSSDIVTHQACQGQVGQVIN